MRENDQQHSTERRPIPRWLKIVIAVVCHGLLGLLLYRARQVTGVSAFRSDLFVFGAPLLFGGVAFVRVCGTDFRGLIFSVGLLAMPTYVYMLVITNVYGT